MSNSKLVGSEVTTYADGSKSITDSYMKSDGSLFYNTYNVTPGGRKHDHVVTDEYGRYVGGHGEDNRPWEDRSRDPNSTFYINE